MSQNTTGRLSQALRTDESRLEAVSTLEQVDSIDEQVSKDLIEDLVYALKVESNSYTTLQLLTQLQRFADQHPQIAVAAFENLVEIANKTIGNFSGDDPSENVKIQRCTDILNTILEGSSGRSGVINIDYADVRGFVENGGVDHRVLAYRLLGRTATGEATRILLRDFSHEVDRVKAAREEGLREATEIVSNSFTSSEYLSKIETIDSFSQLYNSGYVDPTAEQKTLVKEWAFSLSEEASESEREQLHSSVEVLTRTDQELAREITSEAVADLSSGTSNEADTWRLLRACAVGAPGVVAEHADVLAEELAKPGAQNDNKKFGLDVVKTLAERLSSTPAVFADPVLESLRITDKKIVERAIDTVAVMGFYPEPPLINELIGHGNPVVSSAASKAKNRIQDNEPNPSYASDLKSEQREVDLFENGGGDIFLKRRTEAGQWAEVNLGEFREGIVESVVERVARDEMVPVVYPYYEPRDVVALTVALALDGASSDIQLGLYSPGSQTQWGMKGELREELNRYGLSDAQGEVIYAKPIPEIVPDAYISQGQVKDNSDGTGPGRIILAKDIPELKVPSQLDFVLLNSTARSRLDQDDDITSLKEEHPNIKIVSTHSLYTRNDTEGRPRYGPPTGPGSTEALPDAKLVDPVLKNEGKSSSESSAERISLSGGLAVEGSPSAVGSWLIGDDDVRELSQQKEIEIEHVDDETLSRLFDQVFDESAKLRDVNDAGAGSLIFARQMFFERLPVPAADYDEWIRDRLYEGDRYVPPLTQERIEDLGQKAGSIEELGAVQPLNRSVKIFERINERLQRENPLFEVLKRHVSESKQNNESLAIFSESPKNADLLRDVLLKHDIVTEQELKSGQISIVSPNRARALGPHDKMLLLGALHPENAGFYVHPRIDKTVVATYDRSWAGMISRHATEFVELLNGAIGSRDYSPFAEPELVGDTPQPEDTQSDEIEQTKREGEDQERSKQEIIEQRLRSVSGSTYNEESGQYDRERKRYIVETASGEQLELTNHNTVLKQRDTVGSKDLRWVNPETLSEGDTIVTIPGGVEQELWREHLVQLYEQEIGSDRVVDDVERWYDALESIWESAGEELSERDSISETELHKSLYRWLNQEVDDFGRSPQTVKKWFRSVHEAEDGLELAEDPSLTIGPRSAGDIESIGVAFGYEKLANDAEDIENSMEALRSINRREGYDHRDKIREEILKAGESKAAESARYHEVRDLRQHEEEASGDDTETVEMEDDELLKRVLDLVEMAPTKNGELADVWGYDSGSEVYQFLSSELSKYYERNEDSLIVPTKKAKELAESQS